MFGRAIGNVPLERANEKPRVRSNNRYLQKPQGMLNLLCRTLALTCIFKVKK